MEDLFNHCGGGVRNWHASPAVFALPRPENGFLVSELEEFLLRRRFLQLPMAEDTFGKMINPLTLTGCDTYTYHTYSVPWRMSSNDS